MRVLLCPSEDNLPNAGGVREHMEQMFRCFREDQSVQRATSAEDADVVHIESVYCADANGAMPDVYVCHGGFVPTPMPEVVRSIATAKIVISVAEWMVYKYFPKFAHKTIVVHNGVYEDDWAAQGTDVAYQGLFPNSAYVLYPKCYDYYMHVLLYAARERPDLKFVTPAMPRGFTNDPTVTSEGLEMLPENVYCTGLLTRDEMRVAMRGALCILLPGPEVCPTVMLEAWSCGTPAVALAHSGSEELMRYMSPGRAVQGGVLFESAENVLSAIDVVERKGSRMGASGYRKVQQHFLWNEHIFPKYKEIYEAITGDNAEQLLIEKALAC